ncbi:MAG: hypothetical protein EPO62_02770 [Candidatus Nitrosotenuis sp.]|nr:MAG: hypothetical protein EPO62_02770 [Candidatus Nitrosotenuis sp.]
MPLNHTDIKILNFLYSERQRDIYHPPHIDRLIELTSLPPNQVELIVNFLNVKDYVYTYHSPGPVKITASGIDFVERNFDGDKFRKLSEIKIRILNELRSVREGNADKWVTNEHLLQVTGIGDRLYLYRVADYLAQKKLVDLRRRALGAFHIRLSEHGYLSQPSSEIICS